MVRTAQKLTIIITIITYDTMIITVIQKNARKLGIYCAPYCVLVFAIEYKYPFIQLLVDIQREKWLFYYMMAFQNAHLFFYWRGKQWKIREY